MKCPQKMDNPQRTRRRLASPDRRRHLDEDFCFALTFRDADLSRSDASNFDAGQQPTFSAQLQMVQDTSDGGHVDA
jgi:hypothetical protein